MGAGMTVFLFTLHSLLFTYTLVVASVVNKSTINLDKLFKSLPESGRYLVAYSGGMDSHVLLHLFSLSEHHIRKKITAVHINHGLSPNAESWEEHCKGICDVYGIRLKLISIDARHPPGESPESWARAQRYKSLEDLLDDGDILFTAHHMNDQAETLLLQMFRGSGPQGLAGMPCIQHFGKGWHNRPLLEYTKSQLTQYAKAEKLSWIEDESNSDTGFDRNYIRHQVVPVIQGNWPGINSTLSRVASHQSELIQLQKKLAIIELQAVQDGTGLRLDVVKLKQLDEPSQKNLIRVWLKKLGLPVPDSKNMQCIIRDILFSKYDAIPCVNWQGAEIRRYRNFIYASKPLAEHDPGNVIHWDLERPVSITHGVLSATKGTGYGIRADECKKNCLDIRYRRGGESIRQDGKKHHDTLKKLFQENAVPPWLRDRVPLLYIEGSLAAVPGKWIDKQYAGRENEVCWQISWQGSEEIFGKVPE